MQHNSRAEEIVKAHILEPFREKEYGYIGMEFEFPVICLGKEISLKEIGSRFLVSLVENYGYGEEIRGTDGCLVRVGRGGDSVSFDYSYSLLELSMGKQKNLWELQGRMITILRMAQGYYHVYDCVLTGMGTRPVRLGEVEYTYDPFYNMIRHFLIDYAREKDLGKFFPNMCSVQTHIDIPYANLLDTYNLFNRLDFVRGLLFSNSLGKDKKGRTVYCVRDLIWESCGLPNTGIYDTEFHSLEEVARALAQEKIFVKKEGENLLGVKPQTLKEYFRNPDAAEDDIRYFRSFKRVVLNSYHVLEVRGDCVQPVSESFVTAAFHVGIACCCQEAAAELRSFLERNRITAANSRLRKAVITGKAIADEKELTMFLKRMLDIAAAGLAARGCGEERLLEPLRKRAALLTNPAKELQKALCAGKNMKDIIEWYAS
ncbi:MAG: hypothetical protein J1D89_07265 [Agathobacter sp.]|nr:hypothetical protein [Agathobacter sp.]